MEADRWARIGDLYRSARELPQDRRAAFLRDQCNDDEELQKEVESLLACASAATQFLESPALDVAARLIAKDKTDDQKSILVHGAVPSRFRILEELGSGGMGIVYKAEDMKLERTVALKFLAPEFSRDPRALERFRREALAASALNHPNICTVFDVDEHQGQPFIVMELLEGQTLNAYIGGLPLPNPTLIDFAIQICDGLDAAHKKGIIHRDIKPSNIFLTARGSVKLLDFGLAKLLDSEAQNLEQSVLNHTGDSSDIGITRSGANLGTPGYMSPEQIRGERLDQRTDLFSFGVVLYEMATGHRAFEGDSLSTLREAILIQIPTPPRLLNRRLPAKLIPIVNRALERNLAARYQAASQMRTELEGLRHEGIAGALPSSIKWGLAVLLFLLVVGGVLFVDWKAHSEIKFQQLTTNPPENRVNSASISPSGKYLAYAANYGIYTKDLQTGVTKYILKALPFAEEAEDEWVIPDAAWFPDNTRFISNAHSKSSQNNSIWIISRTGAPPRRLRDNAMAWSVSPDGSWIAFGITVGSSGWSRELWLMSPDGGQERRLFRSPADDDIRWRLWAPDSQHGLSLISGSVPGTVMSLAMQEERPIQAFESVEFGMDLKSDPSWLPDGRLIYQVEHTSAVSPDYQSPQEICNFWTMRLDVHTGKPLEKPERLTKLTVCGTSYSAAGDRLVLVRPDGWLYGRSRQGGQVSMPVDSSSNVWMIENF